MNLPLGCRRVLFLVLTLSSAVVAGPKGTCRQQFKTANNCYRLSTPTAPARRLAVMLPWSLASAATFGAMKW
jgi:hypothetical protein